MPGEPGNPNSAFFEIVGETGTQYFGFEVDPFWVERGDHDTYRFKLGLLRTDDHPQAKKIAELILDAVFRPLAEIGRLGDHFSPTGGMRLFFHLLERSRAAKAPSPS